jgi:hypothetical protein
MYSSIFLAFCPLLFVINFELAFGAAPPYGRLAVTNAQLVGSSGQAVALRGMSFYWPQWESQNFWTADVVKQLGCKWNSNLVGVTMFFVKFVFLNMFQPFFELCHKNGLILPKIFAAHKPLQKRSK